MEKLFWFWNLLHFYMYIWTAKVFNLFYLINPLRWFTETKVFKNVLKKRNIPNFHSLMNEIMNNEKSGHNLILAGAHMGGLLVFILSILLFFAGAIFKLDVPGSSIFFVLVIFLVFTWLFNDYVLFRNDIYLTYFEKFRKFDKRKIYIYGWVCIGTIILILGLFIVSVLTYAYVMRNSSNR